MKKSYKTILVFVLELVLCFFAIGNCIYQWTNYPGVIIRGTSIIDFIGYIALTIFFVVVFVKNKK